MGNAKVCAVNDHPQSDPAPSLPTPGSGSIPDPDSATPLVLAEEGSPVLRTFGLRRSFGKFEAVRGLDLEVGEGSIYGFLGRNGAGKTTTIRMLMGILKPDGGEIELLGERTGRTSISQKQRIGYVSQYQHFYPWMTCMALSRFTGGFYPNWDADEFSRLLRIFDLPPQRKFGQLSGGMKMKLALSLALAHRPPLLILDEPTAGLDPVAQREFLDIISAQARDHNRTTFFSTHRIEEVDRIADRVGIIDEGLMRFEGNLDTLKNSVKRVVVRRTASPPPPPPSPSPVSGDPDGSGDSFPTLTAAPPPVPTDPLDALSEENGFERLREEEIDGVHTVAFKAARPELWDHVSLPPFLHVEPLPLEDIFIAYSGAVLRRV